MINLIRVVDNECTESVDATTVIFVGTDANLWRAHASFQRLQDV